MRTITLIIAHCSATYEGRPFIEQALEATHHQRGFDGTDYHSYIRRNGRILTTRSPERPGARAHGYNVHSIGICYEDGLDHYGMPKDTRTGWQCHSFRVLVRTLLLNYPGAQVMGHRDLNPDLNGNGEMGSIEWTKQCSYFKVKREKW